MTVINELEMLGFKDGIQQGAGVYAIIHLASDNVYIGSSVDLVQRCGQQMTNLRGGRCNNKPLNKAFQEDSRIVIMSKPISTVGLARNEEQALVDHFDDVAPETLFNIQRDDVRNALGVPRTEEALKKFSDKQKGHPVSLETRRKISAAQLGKSVTPEFREQARMRALGKPHSLETIEKKREKAPNRQEIVFEGVKYRSYMECERQTGRSYKTIKRHATELQSQSDTPRKST